MKIKKYGMLLGIMAIILLAFAGCARGQTLQLANEMVFSLDGISEVTISYDEETVTFLESDDNRLTIREYMTEDRRSYHANVVQGRDSIQIHEGGKPLFRGAFERYIEVYLPASYHETLQVTTTDGDLDISGPELALRTLRVDSTAGTVRLNRVQAESIRLSSTRGTLILGRLEAEVIRIDTTSARVTCEELDGNVTYTTTSGDAHVQSALGSGSYRADQSGELRVVCTAVTGDLSFFNKNGDICVTLPADLEFTFEATTRNGSVATSFQEWISTTGRTTSGTVGTAPSVTVRAETNHGDIEVIRGEAAD